MDEIERNRRTEEGKRAGRGGGATPRALAPIAEEPPPPPPRRKGGKPRSPPPPLEPPAAHVVEKKQFEEKVESSFLDELSKLREEMRADKEQLKNIFETQLAAAAAQPPPRVGRSAGAQTEGATSVATAAQTEGVGLRGPRVMRGDRWAFLNFIIICIFIIII